MKTIQGKKGQTPAMRRMRRFLADKKAVAACLIVVVITFMCFCAPLLTDCDPNFIDVRLKYAEPSAEHILGCDQTGRDLFARLLYGGRISLTIGIGAALCATALGVALGAISGYFGGWIDQTLMYIRELIMCFPSNIILLVLVGMARQANGEISTVPIMMAVFILTGWASAYGMVRSRVLSLKEETFRESLLANGVGSFSIIFKHLLPNCLGVILFDATNGIGGYILAEAGLSFLGWGVEKGLPTWGNMLNAAQSKAVFQLHPMLWILPGLAILLVVIGFNFFSYGLRDAFDVTEG